MLKAKRVAMGLSVVICLSVMAGDGYTMKCADDKCGYNKMLIVGGGMMFEQVVGWCDTCKDFKSLQWTREGSPMLQDAGEPVPEPKPLATVWVGTLGETRRVYGCPGCKGSFLEVRHPKEVSHCPKCARPGFAIDPDAAHLAVD